MTLDPHVPATERLRTYSAGLILLLMLAGHTALETARDSLFLARLSPRELPVTYGCIAVAALLAAELNGRLRARMAPGALLLLTLVGGALGDLLFLGPFRSHASWAPHAFYVFIAVIATLATSQFWLMVSELFTVLEAKRSFAAISAGGLLGAMLGAGLARGVGARFGDSALLWLGAALLLAAGFAAGMTRGFSLEVGSSDDPPPLAAAASTNAMREPEALRYLKRVLALGLLSTVSATLIDYLFKVQVAQSVSKAELSGFFANFNAAMNAGALLVQIGIAPHLLRRTGIGPSLTFVPLSLLLLGSSVFAAPGLLSVLFLRGSDGGLRYSLHRSSFEVLYLPLPRRVRARWKILVDLIGQRGGQALASIGILAFISAELSVRQMAGVAALLTLGWLLLAATIEPHYVALFRARVKAGAIETRPEVPALDLRSLESLVAALGSDDDDEVLATITLLVDYERAHMIPALLLYHPSREVVLRALEVFADAGRHDYFGAARKLLTRDDDELRAAAMLALAGNMRSEELEAELAKQPALAVRAALLVALTAREPHTQLAAAQEVRAACEPAAGHATRMVFARAMRLSAKLQAGELLPRLLERASPELELEVARAMLATPSLQHIPQLIEMLDSRNVRSVARAALVALGEPALQALRHAANNAALPRRLRAHLPRSISRFGTAAATDLLLDLLEHEPDGWVRFKVVRGLGQVRPHLAQRKRHERVQAVARANLEQALHFLSLRVDLERERAGDARLSTPGGQLLIAALRDKEVHAIDRTVRLIGLSHAPDVIHSIRQALAGPDTRLRADSSELLLHRAPQVIGGALSALLAHGDDRQRQARAAAALSLQVDHAGYATRLSQMLRDSSEVVRSIAAFHVRELGDGVLADSARQVPSAPRFVQELLALTERLLETPAAQARVRRST